MIRLCHCWDWTNQTMDGQTFNPLNWLDPVPTPLYCKGHTFSSAMKTKANPHSNPGLGSYLYVYADRKMNSFQLM